MWQVTEKSLQKDSGLFAACRGMSLRGLSAGRILGFYHTQVSAATEGHLSQRTYKVYLPAATESK